MNSKRVQMGGAFLVAVIAGMLLLAAVPSTVGASSHCTDTVNHSESIQDAVNNADGDTICVEEGIYKQDVVVNKSITLEANGTVVLDGEGSRSTGVLVTADDVTVDGFTVENFTETGVHAFETDQTTVSNTTVNGTDTGILTSNSTSATVADSVVTNGTNGIFALTTGANSGDNLEVRESAVSETDVGLAIIGEDQSSIDNVTLDTLLANETGTGAIIVASEDATVSNVSLTEAALNDSDAGLVLGGINGGTISDAHAERLYVNNNGAVGASLFAHGAGSTVSNLQLNNSVYNETADGPAIRLDVRDGGEVSEFTLNESLVESNQDGIAYNLSDGSLHDVSVRRNLISSNTNGVNISTHGGTTYENVAIRENLINDSDVGVSANPDSNLSRADGFSLTRNVIRDNSKGIVNENSNAVLDARLNYWGATDGPSSSGPLQDPNAKVFADGSGDSVSAGGTSDVSNVRFAPAIGGKSTCGDTPERVGNELVDLVPDETVEADIGDETISGPATDFVGLCAWDRAVLPLRAGTDSAATRARLPDIAIRESGVDVSINRQNLAVYNESEPIPFTFESTDGTANMDMFADEEAQLVVGRVTGEGSGDVSFDVNRTDESATFGSSELEVVDVKNVQLDSNGELPSAVEFTPEDNGTYVAILASRTTGDGFEQTGSGNVSFDVNEDDVTIVGIEGVAVQAAASTATPQKSVVSAGDSVTFDVDANLGKSSDVNHAVVMYHEDTFENSVVTITDYDLTFNDNLSIASGNVTVEVDPPNADPQTLEVEASDLLYQSGVISGTYNGDSFSEDNDLLAGELVIVNNVDPINGSVANTTAGDQTELTLQTGENFRLGDYRYVHVAATDSGEFSTTDGIVGVGAADFTVTDATLSETEITEGDSVDVTATLENSGTVTDTFTANLTVDGTIVQQTNVTVGDGATETVTFTETFDTPGDYEIGVSGTTAGTLTVNEADTTQPPGGGGGGGGVTPPVQPTEPTEVTLPGVINPADPARVDFTVPENASEANVTFEVPETNETRTAGARFTSITVDSNAPSGYNVSIQSTRSAPQSVDPLGEETAASLLYANITYTTAPESFRSARFRFRVDGDRIAGGDPTNVELYRFNESTDEWERFAPEVTHRGVGYVEFSADTDGFSVYAIAQQEPDFQVIDTSLSEEEIQVGESVDVTATIENQGSGNGTETVELLVDGEPVATQDVTLDGGESTTVTFTESFDQAGTYDIAVDDESVGVLEVTEEETATMTATETETPAPGDEGRSPLVYGLLIVLLVLAAAGGYYLFQQQQ